MNVEYRFILVATISMLDIISMRYIYCIYEFLNCISAFIKRVPKLTQDLNLPLFLH